jgi:tetratricopeptide (TPR) repeat protein
MSIKLARQLRRQGAHEQARDLLVRLVGDRPEDAALNFEAACVHDYLGREAEAVPYYARAIAGPLRPQALRSAYLGLGSTYRALGRYADAERTLQGGLAEFPDANELKVFLAMTLHNLGRSKEAVEALLRVLVSTTGDKTLRSYGNAILFYAEDVDKAW